MTEAILGLAITVLVHLAGAVWWASRISANLTTIDSTMREVRTELSALRGEVQAHDTQIAVMQALAGQAASHQSNGSIRP